MKNTIELDKFGDATSLVERFKAHDGGTAKFNIKVRKSDLRLIDRLAELSGRSRAYVVNALIQNILVEMIHEMRDDDEDFAALLALYVDKQCGKSQASVDGWSAALFGVDSYGAQNYWVQREIEEHQPSEKYQELLRRIKGVKK
jgi:hypothetical protein